MSNLGEYKNIYPSMNQTALSDERRPLVQTWPDNCVHRGKPECNKTCLEYNNCKPWIKGER